MHRPCPTLLLLLASVSLACGGGREVKGSARGGPIVFVSIDTLRSDHLPAYGYREVATPAIDRLAADGVLFEHAYSHVPLTFPSHTSVFTGLLPGEHGVRDNLGYRFKAEGKPWLPRLLREAGFVNGAAVSAYVLRAETGLESEFDAYDSKIDLRSTATVGDSQRSCGATLDAALPWVESHKSRPFFLFVHFYEPHTPYTPPGELAERYRDRPYDGEIAAVDLCVARLVDALRAADLYGRATIALFSDHGEGLGDHGEPDHGILLYREALQVPLILKLPGGARGGERVAAPAALVDLLPTIAELVGQPIPPGGAGVSLLGLGPASPSRRIYSESFYPRLHLGWSELTSVIEMPFHLIDGPDPELYDLVRDPAEKSDLRDRERRTLQTLREAAKGFTRELAAPAAEDAETAAKLAALGYLGGNALATTGPLPDPKTKLGTLRDYGRALAAVNQQDYPLAAELCQALVADNPNMVDAWDNLGLALHRLGRSEAAIAAYERAMRLSSGNAHIAISLGHVLLDLGRIDEARRHAELALESSPSAAHALLAEVAMTAKNLELAEREARLALDARGSRIGPLLVLAQVLRDREQVTDALALTDDAIRELGELKSDSKHPGLFFVRADLFARLGQAADAEAAFLREIELFPADTRSYTRLAALYASVGEGERALVTIRLLVDRNSRSPAAWAEAVKTLRVLGDAEGAQRLLAHARGRFADEPALRTL